MLIVKRTVYALFALGALSLGLLFLEPLPAFLGAAFSLAIVGVFFLALDRIIGELAAIRGALVKSDVIGQETTSEHEDLPAVEVADLERRIATARSKQVG